MKIETMFNIGDEVWVPRVYPESHLDSVVVDGKTYWLSPEEATYTFKPRAKKKVITEIELTITEFGITQIYWGRTVGSTADTIDSIVYSTRNGEAVFMTEAEALAFAENVASKGEAFYG